MEIEVSELETRKNKNSRAEERKKECIWGIKDIDRSLGNIQEEGYKLLASNELSSIEKDQLVDIVASAKGSMKIVEKMLAEKSDVSKELHQKIDAKADDFLAGLEGKESGETEE